MARSDEPSSGDPGDGQLAFEDERAADERILVGLARLGGVLRSRLWESAAPRGLNPTQVAILGLLFRGSDGGASLTYLADQLGVSPPTVSDSVNTLVTKGLLVKKPSTADGRTLAITLTDPGRAEAEATDVWPAELLAAVDVLDPAERGRLLRSLVTVVRQLQLSGQMAPARTCATCTFFRPNTGEDAAPHFCAFVEAHFGDQSLRLDCKDHHPVRSEVADDIWERFRGSS